MLRISSLRSWVLVAALGAALPAAAQTTALPFVYDDGAGNSMPYRLFVPPGLEPDVARRRGS